MHFVFVFVFVVMAILYDLTTECKYCAEVVENPRNLRYHEQHSHPFEWAANEQPGTKYYKQPIAALAYCPACQGYQDARNSHLHVKHRYHLFNLANMTPAELVVPGETHPVPGTVVLVPGGPDPGPLTAPTPPHNGGSTDDDESGVRSASEEEEVGISSESEEEMSPLDGIADEDERVSHLLAQESSFDWLKGRNDPLNFAAHPLVGEVFVLAAKDNNRVVQSLAVRSQDVTKYNRWRVVLVEDSEDPHGPADEDTNENKKYATLYNINEDSQFVPRPFPGATARARTSNAATHSFTVRLELEELLEYGTQLGHGDVLKNLGDMTRCESCLLEFSPEELRCCDGCFPACIGANYPADALGRQHACRRGVTCQECDDSREQKFWLCKKCKRSSSRTEDAWGSGVVLQALGLAPGSVHAANKPVSPLSQLGVHFEHPFDAAMRKDSSRAERITTATIRFARQGGSRAVEAASKLLKVFRRNFFSRSAQVDVLAAVNNLYDNDLLGETPSSPEVLCLRPECLIPKTLGALEGRGAPALVTEGDIESRIVRFSTESLGQLQQYVEMVIGDVPAYLQSILDDLRNPIEDWFFVENSILREYTTEDNKPLFGPEVYHGKEWRDKEKTIPAGAYMMGLCVSSDETVGMGGTRYPLRISIANLSMNSRFKDAGTRLAAMLAVIVIRKPRNSKKHERLHRAQKAAKRQILAAAPAHVLADLDHMARQPVAFRMWEDDGEGGRKMVKRFVSLRVLLYISDKKEEQALLGLTSSGCPRCMSLEEAMRREANEGRAQYSQSLHFMRCDDKAGCAEGERRTVPDVVRHQVELNTLAVTRGVTVADKRANALSVRYDVEIMLHRLVNLFPHPQGPYSAFGTDWLHVYGSGVCAKCILMIDAFICKFHGVSRPDDYISREDARNRLDEKLARIPSHPGLLTFSTGWWDNADMGSVSSSESSDFLKQLPFTIVGDPLMIANTDDRIRVLAIIMLLVDRDCEHSTNQWYTTVDLNKTSANLCLLSREMRWMHGVLGADCPGEGMNISKFHDFLNCRRMIEDFGSLQNSCSGPFEMRMKTLKKNDARVVRTRADDRGSLLFNHQQANELEVANPHTFSARPPAPDGRAARLTMGRRSCFVGRGLVWEKILTSLEKGVGGPRFPKEFLDVLGPQLNAALCFPQGAPIFAQAQIVTAASEWVAMPGHTVELSDGHHAQLLVSAPTNGAHSGLRFVVIDFVQVQPTRRHGMHPEFPMLWLKRSNFLRQISATQVKKRVHIIELNGNHGRPQGDTSVHFLLNTTVNPKYVGPENRVVYLSCPHECGGRLLKPETSGERVQCGTCRKWTKWM